MPTSAPRSPLLLALLLAAPACGDDGGTASATGSTSTATDTTTGEDTSAPATASTTGESDATSAPTSGSATASATATSTTDASTSASTTGGDEEALPPTESAELLEQWLEGGAYKDWPAESQVHPSDGPHGGNVRTYVNPALAQSLAGAAAMHPQGAATVKELYGGGTDTLVGYAVMVKLAPDSQGGDGWYWYERLNATVYADGTGVGLCTACHVGGSDYILTPYPLQ